MSFIYAHIDWKPASAAPKDGRQYLVYMPGAYWSFAVAFSTERGWYRVDGYMYEGSLPEELKLTGYQEPSHWAELYAGLPDWPQRVSEVVSGYHETLAKVEAKSTP